VSAPIGSPFAILRHWRRATEQHRCSMTSCTKWTSLFASERRLFAVTIPRSAAPDWVSRSPDRPGSPWCSWPTTLPNRHWQSPRFWCPNC